MLIITQSVKDTSELPETHKKRKQNFFLKFLSFLLALVLTVALLIAVPATLLRCVLTDHNIEVIVDHVISNIEIEKLEFQTADGSKTLSGVLLEVTDEFEGWDHITEEQINDALLSDFVKQFITDTLKQYGMSLKEGEEMLGWTPEQIYAFVEANKETIERLALEAGYEGNLPITEKKDMMISNIEERIGKDGISVNALLGESEETEKLREYLDMAQLVFSDSTVYLVWGVVAFIAALLVLINYGYFGNALRSCGYPAFIVGTLCFLLTFAVDPALALIEIPNEIAADIVSFTVDFIVGLMAQISLIMASVGIALILLSYLTDAVGRTINKNIKDRG